MVYHVGVNDYDRIRSARSDVSDYLVHIVKGGFPTLLDILRDGYLRASFAERNGKPTIKGPRKAVCFSEMSFTEIRALHDADLAVRRYSAHGVRFPKKYLYRIGARPVIYANDSILGAELESSDDGYEEGKSIYTGGLRKEDQFRWVVFDLRRDPPIDWTHEREWRAPTSDILGVEGVPLHQWSERAVFEFFVSTEEEKTCLQEEIRSLASNRGTTPGYFEVLPQAKISVI